MTPGRLARLARRRTVGAAFAAIALAATGLSAPLDARAQQAWPERPITMIVPFPPGGVADTVARPVAGRCSAT
jgi:tripartite-type tricarboxylate transporter receptor subunit TctC